MAYLSAYSLSLPHDKGPFCKRCFLNASQIALHTASPHSSFHSVMYPSLLSAQPSSDLSHHTSQVVCCEHLVLLTTLSLTTQSKRKSRFSMMRPWIENRCSYRIVVRLLIQQSAREGSDGSFLNFDQHSAWSEGSRVPGSHLQFCRTLLAARACQALPSLSRALARCAQRCGGRCSKRRGAAMHGSPTHPLALAQAQYSNIGPEPVEEADGGGDERGDDHEHERRARPAHPGRDAPREEQRIRVSRAASGGCRRQRKQSRGARRAHITGSIATADPVGLRWSASRRLGHCRRVLDLSTGPASPVDVLHKM